MYELTILLIGFILGFLTKYLKDGQKTEHVITINNSTPRNIADAVYFGVLHSFQEFTIKYNDDVDLNDTMLAIEAKNIEPNIRVEFGKRKLMISILRSS